MTQDNLYMDQGQGYSQNPGQEGYAQNQGQGYQQNQGPGYQQDQPYGYQQEFSVQGSQLVDRVKELIHEGNVREIIVKHEGHTILHIPVTVGVVGALIAPQLAALGAIGALLTHCTIEVIRSDRP